MKKEKQIAFMLQIIDSALSVIDASNHPEDACTSSSLLEPGAAIMSLQGDKAAVQDVLTFSFFPMRRSYNNSTTTMTPACRCFLETPIHNDVRRGRGSCNCSSRLPPLPSLLVGVLDTRGSTTRSCSTATTSDSTETTHEDNNDKE